MNYQLSNLWDLMRKFRLDLFWLLAAHWNDAATTVIFADGNPDDPLSNEEKERLSKVMDRFRKVCEDIDLSTSSTLLRHKSDNPPKSSGEMDMIWLAIRSELESKLFIHIPDDRTGYYEKKRFPF